MCGIAGIVRFDGKAIATATLDAMQRAIKHRGLDGEGRYMTPQCALLHARLSIVDIAGGAQPMHLDANEKHVDATVVFNGEIYNHRELRKELIKLGHRFKSDHSDTEVLLHGYREWGMGLTARIWGMFAIAIWDGTEKKLVLIRDAAGKKPLFYRYVDGTLASGVIFASEPSAVFAGDAPPFSVNESNLHRYLALGYSKAMLPNGYQVEPGCALQVGPKQMDPTSHWIMPKPGGPTPYSEQFDAPLATLAKTASEYITAAVDCRLEADVPLGCFLSAGVDSAIVAAIANEALKKRKAGPLRTFTVKVPDADYDESEVAQEVARRLGTVHQTLTIDPSANLFKDLAMLISLTGEPTADSSILPTYWMCKAARAHVKVALSGDGGDELFGGYDRYRALRFIQRYRWMLARISPGGLGKGADGRAFGSRVRRLIYASKPKVPALQYERMIRIFSNEAIDQLRPGLPDISEVTGWQDKSGDPVNGAMIWDRQHYLPCDVLRKVDRASMAAGIEVRSPLLDRDVMTWACSFPATTLMRGGKPKAILRTLAGQLVGEDIASLPKRGFGLPIGGWFATSLHEELRQRLVDGPLDTIGFQKAVIAEMLTEHKTRKVDHTHRLFALLALSMWVESMGGARAQ